MIQQVEFALAAKHRGCHLVTREIIDRLPKPLPKAGLLNLFVKHTSCALSINENADPDVKTDLLYALEETFPNRPQFRHAEGNSDAHMKSSCVGASETVIIDDNELLLGTWQGIYFAEFDVPRTRNFFVKIIKG